MRPTRSRARNGSKRKAAVFAWTRRRRIPVVDAVVVPPEEVLRLRQEAQRREHEYQMSLLEHPGEPDAQGEASASHAYVSPAQESVPRTSEEPVPPSDPGSEAELQTPLDPDAVLPSDLALLASFTAEAIESLKAAGERVESGTEAPAEEAEPEPGESGERVPELPIRASGNVTLTAGGQLQSESEIVGERAEEASPPAPEQREITDTPPEAEPQAQPAPELTCEIAFWRGYRKAGFYARAFDQEGYEVAVAESPYFKARGNRVPDQTEQARAAYEALSAQLAEAGWKAEGRNGTWFGTRFRRPVADVMASGSE
jgi:hypothetical protein